MTMTRNYRVHGLSPEGTVLQRLDDGRVADSGLRASEFAGSPEQLAEGEVFDYFDPDEERILRKGMKLDARLPKKARKSRSDVAPLALTQAPEVAPSGPLACRMCKATKPAEDFSLMRTSKTGRRSYCRACAKAYAASRKVQS